MPTLIDLDAGGKNDDQSMEREAVSGQTHFRARPQDNIFNQVKAYPPERTLNLDDTPDCLQIWAMVPTPPAIQTDCNPPLASEKASGSRNHKYGQSENGQREEPTSQLEAQPVVVKYDTCCKQFLDFFTQPCSVGGLALGAVMYYIGIAANIAVSIMAVRDGRWRLFFISASSVTCPQLLHAANVYFVLSIVKKDMPSKKKMYEVLFCALNLNRAREAYLYWKGQTPIWSLLFKDRLGNITLSVIPVVTFGIMDLLSGDIDDDSSKGVLIATTFYNLLKAAWTVRSVHTCSGPPGNIQKYRFWDLETNPWRHIFVVLLIDCSQVIYRVLLLALVAAFAGVHCALALMVGMSAAVAGYTKIGFSVIQAYEGSVVFMSAITGLENTAFDYPWLEPVPVYSYYIEASFLLRAIQAIVGGWLIASNWQKHQHWNQSIFHVVFSIGVVSAIIYFTLYPAYVFHWSKDHVAASYRKRDSFMSSQLKQKFDREELASELKQKLDQEKRNAARISTNTAKPVLSEGSPDSSVKKSALNVTLRVLVGV